MTNKLMEDKKAEFFDTITAVNNLTENEATWWWQWIEKLVEEVEKETKERIICKDSRVHDFKLVAESPSVENYYQIHECQKCGFKRKSINLLNA